MHAGRQIVALLALVPDGTAAFLDLWRRAAPPVVSGEADATVAITPDPTTRLAFASCKDGTGESSNFAGRGIDFDWSVITERRPHAFVWGGDSIYGDAYLAPRKPPGWLRFVLPDVPYGKTKFKPATPAHLHSLYSELKSEPGYAELRANVSAVLGTWDDHDYGVNDGDKTYEYRAESKEEFLDFLDAAPADARRARGTDVGVYGSTLLDGGDPERSILVVALDMRYSKDPYSQRKGDFLGEEQWAWLEATLNASTARVHVIVSSLQLLPTGRESVSECWNDFPNSRDRLLRTLIKHRTRSPVVVSGDVHYAELMEARCGDSDAADLTSAHPLLRKLGKRLGLGPGGFGLSSIKYGSTFVELTTSGLTHSWRGGMSWARSSRESAFYMSVMNSVTQYLQRGVVEVV